MKAMGTLLLVLMVMTVANLVGKQEACGMCPGGVCTGSIHVTNTEATVQRLGQHHGSVRDDFDFDGRHVNVVLPDHIRGRSELPMVIALIGFGVPGEVMLTDAGGPGCGKLAEMDDVIVVAPDPSVHPVLGATFWNATDACCGFESVFGPQVDDVDYLTRLTDTLLDRYPVNRRRVYVVGHSNGGFMVHRLACDVPDRYAGFVAMAGATFYNVADCGLHEKINLLQIQGTVDPVNLPEGGSFPLAPDVPYPGAIGTVDRVAGLVGCHGPRVNRGRIDLEPDLTIGDSQRETQVSSYAGCHGARVDLWLVEGAGHLWFISCDPTVRPDCTFPQPPKEGSKTAAKIWQWMQVQHH